MEFAKFIHLLRKHKYGLIGIPILVMGITFFLVRKLPNVYSSQSRLSAGLTAGSGTMELAQQLLNSQGLSESKVSQTFSNVTQTMQLKIVFDQVSYQLILHDLKDPEHALRKPSKLLNDLTPDARKHAIEVYTKLYNNRQALYLTDPDQQGLNDVIISMKYDYETLKGKLRIYRVESSDFIDVQFESDNPIISAFVVNTLCNEFISYYSTLTQQNKVKATDFLYEAMNKKKDSLNAKKDALKDYKVKNRILNIKDQTQSLYAQISNFETLLQATERDVEANTGAIRSIDAKFNEQERQYMEAKLTQVNQEIVSIQEQLNVLNDQYVKSNFDKGIKAKIDGLKDALAQKVNQSTDKYIVNPLATKENLVMQRLKLEMDLSLAKNSINSYRTAISRLNRRLETMAPNEAAIQSYEADILQTEKEYLEILARYNLSAMQLSTAVPIKVIEAALPGIKMPSKKLVLVVFSGIASMVIYLLILFILFYLDDSVKNPDDLMLKTDSRVLGALPVIKTSFLDIQKLWNIDPPATANNEYKKLLGPAHTDLQKISGVNPINPANAEFKKMIRAARFEINMALAGGRNLVITSLAHGEGKTLVSLSLVSAFQMMNKRVLLIDGNFLNPGITMMAQPKYYIEDYLKGKTKLEQFTDEGTVSVLGNKGLDVSLFELNTESEIEQKVLELKDVFDIVVIEASALDTLNQAKEWIVVADRVMAVYEANRSINHTMKEQILYLKSMEGKFIGWILNKTTK